MIIDAHKMLAGQRVLVASSGTIGDVRFLVGDSRDRGRHGRAVGKQAVRQVS